ncbi:MAG: hypothetical protein ACI9YE_001707 [Psychroserpens sp.]|jgi:hypothetical protein
MVKNIKLHFNHTIAFYWNLFFIIVLIGSLAVFYLPERYMADALLLAKDPYNQAGLLGSYPFSFWFYQNTGLASLSFPLIAWIQIPIVFILLYRLGLPDSFKSFTLRNTLVWMGLLVFGIYMGFPSKEFITILWVFLVAFILKKEISLSKKVFLSTILFLFFGWFYREYFILVPILALGIYFFSFINIKNKVLFNITVGLVIVSFMSLSHGIIKGQFITQAFRNKLNTERVSLNDQSASTMILSPIEPDTFHGEVFGIFYGFFSVNLPITGMRFLLKPQVLIFVVWQILLFCTLIYYYRNAYKSKTLYNHELWVFHLLFAYFIIQGIFEPDLGSAVKHKLGVFPLIWLAMYYDKGLIKKPKINKKYVFRITK